MTVSTADPLTPLSIQATLAQLAHDLVQARLALARALPPPPAEPPQPRTPFDPAPYLAAASPLFAALHAANRASLVSTASAKKRTLESRTDMEDRWLRLQNLKFEQNHLEREIRSCEEYESSYQLLPLPSHDEFLALYTSGAKDLPELPNKADAHEVQLAILEYELGERRRLEESKKSLSATKALLIKSNEVRKNQLEDLERQLEGFVTSAKGIQERMHAVEGKENKEERASAPNGTAVVIAGDT